MSDQRPLTLLELAVYLRAAQIICQRLDDAETLAHGLERGKRAQDALVLARYYVNRCR